MLKISRVVIISILIFTQFSLVGQNNTNSPYTRFGYGQLADRSFGAGRAMGGVGIGLRSSKQINPLNPASYSAMDSLTFLFDFGVSGQMAWLSDDVNSLKLKNANFDYAAIQFPITRRIAMSLGIVPYSFVGYNFGQVSSSESTGYSESFYGTGGLNEVYGGLSIDIWKKRLSVGANVGYLFGNIDHMRALTLGQQSANNVVVQQRVQVRDMKLDFGLQYTHPLSATDQLTLGLTYSPSNKLNTKSYTVTTIGSAAEGDTITGQRFDIPNSYGVGLSYMKANKLTLAADFMYEEWSKAQFFDSSNGFDNRFRVAGGVEYIPDYTKRSFLNRVRYRAGVHYGNSYQKINMGEEYGNQRYGYDEYGASIGFGLPLIDNRSLINISLEYAKIRPELKAMVAEDYFRITINYTFNEFWFLKRKID